MFAIVLVGIIFLVLFVGGVGVPGSLTRLAHAVGTSFWHAQPMLRAEVTGLLKLFGSKGELVSENMWLEDQITKARLALTDYDVVLEENNQLREALERSQDTDRIVAGVLQHPNTSPYDTLLIDVGSDNGIAVGNSVFASDRVLIGAVEQVQRNTARVELLSSPDVETDIVFENSEVTLRAVGRGGGNIVIEVPREVDVATGERLFLPGLLSTFIGSVSSVESHPADAVQTVRARLPINVYTLQEVFIEL